MDTRPAGPDSLDLLARLFATQRSTRHCWCTAFCVSRTRFSLGWVTGQNDRQFAQVAAASDHPMGILALAEQEPVGWCACGPRSRYARAADAAGSPLRDRDRSEDERVWLLPCVFVRDGYRGQGVSHALVRAAVDLARRRGAAAVEGWPPTTDARQAANGFLGRREVLEAAGFRRVDRHAPGRLLMRLDLF